MKSIIPRRKQRIRPLVTGSSFAESEPVDRRRRPWSRKDAYDTAPMRPVGPEYAPDPVLDRPRRHPVRRVFAALILAMALGVIVALVVLVMSFRAGSDVKAGTRVTVTIARGATASTIANQLSEAGVVRNKMLFLARLRLNGDATQFKAGTYRLRAGASYDTIVTKLQAGPPPPVTFNMTFPEGLRIVDMSRTIDAARAESSSQGKPPLPAFTGRQFERVVARMRVPGTYQPPRGTTSMEGFLFPATFELRKSAGPQALADRQLAAFTSTMDGIDLSYAKQHNLTPYEVVVIASMVEREARLPKERPLVAAVIYNRLRDRMTLGIDATIQYKVSGRAGWKTALTESDLAIDSPFNSRLQIGLPPTPIASPGKSSLEAAAHPAKVDYLYYVANPNSAKGNHFFTKSYDAFLAHPYQNG